jgi:GT2 family glycosyltransferase
MPKDAIVEPSFAGGAHPTGRAPRLSVVMPVRNGLPFLDESVRSILAQTFADFELIALDDASTDATLGALREWARADSRVSVYHSARRLGLSGSSNFVVERARAPLVARMDADDVAHPERLARQFEVMRGRPDAVLVGTLSEGIDAVGRSVRPRDRWRLLRPSRFPPFPHGSAMFRRAAFDAVGGYREECAAWEDQDLFLRLARRGRVLILPDALYYYRYHDSSATIGATLEGRARIFAQRQRCLAEYRAGRDYAGLLAGAAAAASNGSHAAASNGYGARATAEALYEAGAMRLWAGQRPSILGAALGRGRLSLSPRALSTLVLGLWGGVSPSSLRTSMRSFIRARDLLAGRRMKDGSPREWRSR